MKIRKIVSVVLVLIIAAAGWFFVSPLFIDETVDEPFFDHIPTRAQVDAMEPAARDAMMTEMMTRAAAAPNSEVDEPMDRTMAETPLILAVGQFKDADAIHKGSGNASLFQLTDGSHVVRLDDFRVTNGPALVVLLAEEIKPQNANDVKRGYVKLGELKGNVGNQNYAVPANINPSAYGSVVIWCELFDVLFSAAPLNIT
ncbi:MAG: DM13 domain-containing protein [Gammaproteobacteria bacterium]|nr:DM13 domain-containing protein [Gammaproteobacteria bacterium]MDH3767749.1 DM13 domain-containing protein [Gammaproteobacteria bacterium]